MTKLIFIINELVNGKFTGTVEINFFNGGIRRVSKHWDENVEI